MQVTYYYVMKASSVAYACEANATTSAFAIQLQY